MSEETVIFNLEVNVEETLGQIRQLEGILYRTFGLLNRLGLPENIDNAIMYTQRLIMILRLLHTTLILLTATEAISPIGWLRIGTSLGATAMSALTLAQDLK